jgi:chromosomal replication initiation ATPase DnaA
MKVQILIEADLMDGQTLDNVTAAEVLGCDNASIIQVIRTQGVAKNKEYLVNKIAKDICKEFDITIEDLKGKYRGIDHRLPRHAFCLILKRTCKFSYKSIGEYLGGRGHHTIINSVKIAREMIETFDEQFEPYALAIKRIEKSLR